jgi:hypothetical protein
MNEFYTENNCYEILQVPVTSSPQEIQRSFRILSKRFHPDLSRDVKSEEQVRINLAYEILRNPELKEKHDRHWRIHARKFIRKKKAKEPDVKKEEPSAAESRPKKKKRKPATLEPLYTMTREAVKERGKALWDDQDNRVKQYRDIFTHDFLAHRSRGMLSVILFLICGGLSFVNPLFILGSLIAVPLFLANLSVEIHLERITIFNDIWQTVIEGQAKKKARKSCEDDIRGLDKYDEIVDSLSFILKRPMTPADSEESMARRITTALFLTGSVPVDYFEKDRVILFKKGSEKIVARFRHRKGKAATISFVKRLTGLMEEHGSAKGYLFCSPGLSAAAARFTRHNAIRAYSLDAMNDWIHSVLSSGHTGPAGDLLKHLDDLISFISNINDPRH